MATSVKNILELIQGWAPPYLKMDYDNVGLLVGNPSAEVNKILTTLDLTEAVVDEAISSKADLIIAHHPLIFKPLKSISRDTEVGRIIYKLIENNISYIAAHTNLDAAKDGVSWVLAKRLGLQKVHVLAPSTSAKRFCVNIYEQHQDDVEKIIHILEDTFGVWSLQDTRIQSVKQPTLVYKLEASADLHTITTIKTYLQNNYANCTVDTLDQSVLSKHSGFGVIGEFETAQQADDFLQLLCEKVQTKAIRFSTGNAVNQIKKVALCGGTAVGFASKAKKMGADAYVTADIKYHEYFNDHNDFLLIDVGHFESEIWIAEEINSFLREKVSDEVAIATTQVNTNPMQIFINNNN